ncbi:pilus assembly protein TadG-related protein [Melissospora conviva]|uniref:pilus assembly protein TadG-related protein n=1 Tax=Melissospora conviva TaxID=3388432 RepID=UPI003B7DDBA9
MSSGAGRGDAGRVSVFLAIALLAVLAVIGLTYDGSAQLRMTQRAENLAAEAARTGGQEIDRGAAVGGGVKAIDPAAATAAAYRYLDSVTLPENVHLTRSARQVPDPDGGAPTRLEVTVILTYEPVMLSLFGAGDLTATGSATARLLTERP